MSIRVDANERADMVLVGQTPPPFHGQALGIKAIAEYPFARLRVRLVRMAFSEELKSVGRFHVYKLWHLLALAVRIIAARLRSGARVLYYPPAGPNWAPVGRDLILLPLVRPFFAITVFHYRAAGLGCWLDARGRLVRWLAGLAYGRADLAILMSARLAETGGGVLRARHTTVIPNGVADLSDGRLAVAGQSPGRILFVGALRPEKGVDVLLDALILLHKRDIECSAQLVGKPVSARYQQALEARITDAGLAPRVVLCGEQRGDRLREAYAGATIFCLPTQYESEAMPRVVIEAMQFGLPVVATAWRGIPDMIEDGVQGVLTPVGDVVALMEALASLLRDPARGARMGTAGRQRYEACFTVKRQMLEFERAVLTTMENIDHA